MGTTDDLVGAEIAALRRRADRNAHGHIAQALRLQTLHDISTFVATIGGAAVMAASAVILGASKPIREIEIALAIIGAVITLVGVWQAVWRPGERSLDHKRWAARFTIIEDDCRQLACGAGSKGLAELLGEPNAGVSKKMLRWKTRDATINVARGGTRAVTIYVAATAINTSGVLALDETGRVATAAPHGL